MAPKFQMPFPSGQTWEGQTRENHSPKYSVDFNRAGDESDPVVAAAAGTVSRVENEGNRSYGRWVEIDYGGGWRTRYAHLSRQRVQAGEKVKMGDVIGNVGNTGGSSGAHLHFEQLHNGSAVKISFNGSQIKYFGTGRYTSRNSSGGGPDTAQGRIDTNGTPLTVRSGPGTSHKAVGQVADGAQVTIYCQTQGSTVTGTFGTSNLWDRIGSGRYVADVYVYTGSDGRVAPDC